MVGYQTRLFCRTQPPPTLTLQAVAARSSDDGERERGKSNSVWKHFGFKQPRAGSGVFALTHTDTHAVMTVHTHTSLS